MVVVQPFGVDAENGLAAVTCVGGVEAAVAVGRTSGEVVRPGRAFESGEGSVSGVQRPLATMKLVQMCLSADY